MALTTATITYDLADQSGADFDARRTKVWATTNLLDETVIDTTGNQIRLGSANGTVNADGTGFISVWTPGTGSNPASWQTYIHVDYPDRHTQSGRKRRTFGPFTITTSADLADLVTEMEVPAEYLTTVTADLNTIADGAAASATSAAASATSAAASAALAHDISGIDTSDGVVDALLADPASDTSVRLKATYAAMVVISGAGIDPTGVADSTTAIQAKITAAPDRSTIWFPPGIYKCGNLTISNKVGLTVTGQGLIQWTGTPTGGDAIGFQLVGTLTNLTITGLRMTGDGVVANAHAGVWCYSGQTITNLQILRNRITDVMLGISINADGSGDIDGLLIQGNDLRNIVGTASGAGYGIQFASTDDRSRGVRIIDNVIRRAQRHGIYVGKGSGVTVAGNHLVDHRIDVHDDSQRVAMSIARGSGHVIEGNIFHSCWDGCLDIFPNPTTPTANIVVRGNVFKTPKGSVPALVVGSTSPATEGNVTDLLIEGNSFYQDAGSYEFIRVYAGKRVTITQNILTGTNLTTAMPMIHYYASGESGATATYSDRITASFNRLYASGTTGEALGFRFENAVATSTARLSFLFNDITAIGGSYANMYAGVAVTNPNIQVMGDTYAGLSGLTPTTTKIGPTTA